MRDLVLWLLFPAAFIWGLSSASASVLVLNWIWFQRPYDFSWGFWATAPMFIIGIGIAIVSNAMRGQFRPRMTRLLALYMLLMLWITLSTAFAFNTQISWAIYKAYMPTMLLAPIVIFATIHDLDLLKKVLWVAVGGIALNASKVGAVLTAKGGGHLTDQISGFVGDNNVFGLVLCLVLAGVLGLRTSLPDKRWAHMMAYTAAVLIALCIIYTKSRGALLSMGVILTFRMLFSQKPVRNLLLLFTIAAIGYNLVPATYFDRLGTLQNVQADTSAQGRIENWGLSWREAVDNPLFGVGPENHIPYNRYTTPGVQVRVAHSVYFQILGELGFPGLILYLLFILSVFVMLIRTWRALVPIAQQHPDLAWARDFASWMTFGWFGYMLGSGLLNMLWIEFPWFIALYCSMLLPMVRKEVARRAGTSASDPPAPQPAGRGRFRAYGRRPQWAR